MPSPLINVLCANMSSDEMVPMVFTEWHSESANAASLNTTSWPNDYNLTIPSSLTHTVVDDLFGFDDKETHPIFPKLPQPYNIILNASSAYGHQSIYLLVGSANSTDEYTMCSMRVAQSPDCFTEYYASMSGGSLTSYCGDYSLAYNKSRPEAPRGVWEKDWKDVASEWGFGLSLNAGISDGKSAIARLLTQLIPQTNALNPNLPSISEALAVLAGCTLILSSQGAPFVHCKSFFLALHSLLRIAFEVTGHATGANPPYFPLYSLDDYYYQVIFIAGMLTLNCVRLELLVKYPR